MSPVQLEQPVEPLAVRQVQRASPACRAIAICGVSATTDTANINEAMDVFISAVPLRTWHS